MQVEKVIIVGSGPAAYTAALYTARAHLNPLIIEGKEPGGQLMSTTYVENWPGTERILGPELMRSMRAQAEKWGTRFVPEQATNLFIEKPFRLKTHKDKIYTAHTIIIATGADPKRLGCPGESTYWGKGVTSCAVCDGAFYRDKKVIIVGGGDSAMENASFMTNFTQDITIVHILDKLTASAAMQERILTNASIKILYNSTIEEIKGDEQKVTAVVIGNKITGQQETIEIDGVFISIGLKPNTEWLKGTLKLDQAGYLQYAHYSQTSVEGVFAAGDVADSTYRQAVTSAGTGCMAALDVERFLKRQGIL